MVAFEEHFWGEKYNGFDVLLQNFKLGASASKEFGEFVRERSNIEETYSKSLLKLSHKCSAAYNHVGSFEPCWKFLQSSTEKLASAHQQIIQNLHEVMKTLKEYGELQKEKQKQLKEEFTSTAEVVQNMQFLSNSVIKAKDIYQQKSTEVDKCRKESTNIKEIEKTESKLKKVCEDYKSLVEKRENTRKEFEEKMIAIAKKFQVLEEEHLNRMCDILKMYGSSLTTDKFLISQIIDEFERNMLSFTTDSLLQQFVYGKQTGKSTPASIEFQEIPLQEPPIDIEALAGREEEKKKKKKEKRERKEKRLKKRKNKATENGTVQGPEGTPEPAVEVDEEGYTIRPHDTDSLRSSRSRDSLSYDSDSDSDDEPRKLQITIKPKDDASSNTNPSVDELRALGAQLTLPSPSSLKKFPTMDERKFGGSQNSIDKAIKLSSSSNALMEAGTNSFESWNESGSIKSHPSNSSLDAFTSTAPTAASSGVSVSSGNNLDSLFDNSFFGSHSTSAQDISADSGSSQGDKYSFEVEEEMPPPLPVKKRSSSSLSLQSSPEVAAESKTATVTENESKEGTISPPSLIGAPPNNTSTVARQRPRAYQLPVLAPPSNPRRLSASNRPTYRPNSAQGSTSVSPPQTSGQVPTGLTSSSSQPSSLMDLAGINFTPSWPAATTTTNTVANSSLSEGSGTPWISVSDSPETRGDTQAPNALGTVSPPPVATSERVTPIAVAFIETVNAYFKGADQAKCMVKVTGDMTVSFPSAIVAVLTSETPPNLSFAINGTSSLELIFPNKALVEREGQVAGGSAIHFRFNVSALASYLKKQSEHGTSASYYNVDILKYQVRTDGVNSLPLHLCAYWRCDKTQTDLKIDYKYNSASMASQVPLSGISLVVPVDGGVEIMQSKPTATWSGEHQRALWKLPRLPVISDGPNKDCGSLRARFDISKGPSNPSTVAVQFCGDGTILSNLNFEVRSPALKLSLVKKRFSTGKYFVDP